MAKAQLFTFTLLSHSLFIDSRNRRWGEHEVFWLLAPCPCKRVLKFPGTYEDQTHHHSPASSFSSFLFSSQIYGSPSHHTGNTHLLTSNKLTCPPLLASFYLVFLFTYLLQLKCLHFTNSLTWCEQTFQKKRKSRRSEQIWASSLLFSKETGNWWRNTRSEFACKRDQTVAGRKESKQAVGHFKC